MHAKLVEKTIDRLTLPPGKPQLVVWDEDLPGFGVVIGKTATTFIVNYRASGVMRRQVIGRHGSLREDGHPWNATTARQRARELLGQVAGGADPSAEVRQRH